MFNFFLNILFVFLLSSLLLIMLQKNPVYSVFSFIFTAIIVFLFFLVIKAEFFALLILIIYTGVITVLFLFVVIMYNLSNFKVKINLNFFLVIPFFFFSLLLNSFFFKIFDAFKYYNLLNMYVDNLIFLPISITSKLENEPIIFDMFSFSVLFNDYFILFLFVGILIFIAMIGSIIITYPFFKHNN